MWLNYKEISPREAGWYLIKVDNKTLAAYFARDSGNWFLGNITNKGQYKIEPDLWLDHTNIK